MLVWCAVPNHARAVPTRRASCKRKPLFIRGHLLLSSPPTALAASEACKKKEAGLSFPQGHRSRFALSLQELGGAGVVHLWANIATAVRVPRFL